MEEIVNDIWNEKCLLSPSLICLDMLHLADQICELEESGIKLLHVDILDGHFSPSMPLGFETLLQLRQVTDIPFDCHVMANPPDFFIEELCKIGVQQVVFHWETAVHPDALINYLHSKGIRAGVALKPSTPLSVLDYELEKCDNILLMQINPGYASSKTEQRVAYADRKIRELRQMINERKVNCKITIDGRVSLENIEEYGNGIVDIFVGGTTVISKMDIKNSVGKVMQLRQNILGK